MALNSRSRPLRTTSLILVILVLLIIFWPSDPTKVNTDSSSHQHPQARSRAGTEETRSDRTGSTRVIRARSKNMSEDGEFDPYVEWELSKILCHFMVPPGDFRAGTINDSIAKLKAIYREYSGHELEISLEAPVIPNNAISFEHDNISFRTLLGMVAGLSGYSLKISNQDISFTTIQPPPRRPEIMQSSPLALSDERMEEILTNPEKTREYLTSLGLHTPEVFGFPNDPNKLENLINSLQDARLDPENTPRQVHVQNKLISFPPGFEFEATDMNTLDLQIAMRKWSQEKGVDIMTAPSVTTNPGQKGTIEIGQEYTYPIETESVEFRNEFIGLRMTATPVLAGLDQIQIGGEVNFSSMELPPNTPPAPEFFQLDITETEIHAHDGRSVLIPLTGEDGATTIQIITSRRIDATGKAFWPPNPE